MKMAERQNILAMGLDPADVISFGGGWVNHPAPEEFRQAYLDVVSDPALFHQSGGYTATLGEMSCREQIARFEQHLFAMPRIGPEHIAIGLGSTQLTHDLFRTLLDPGDTVMLLDPTYANYEGQLAFVAPGIEIVRLPVLDAATWSYRPLTDPEGVARDFTRLFDQHRPKLVLFGAPDNPTSQVVPQALAELMLERTSAAGLLHGWSPTAPFPHLHSRFTRTRSGHAAWGGAWAGSKRPRQSSRRSNGCSSAAFSAPTRSRRWRCHATWQRPSTAARSAATWTRPTASTPMPRG